MNGRNAKLPRQKRTAPGRLSRKELRDEVRRAKRTAPGRLSRKELRDEVRRACRYGATDDGRRRLEGCRRRFTGNPVYPGRTPDRQLTHYDTPQPPGMR